MKLHEMFDVKKAILDLGKSLKEDRMALNRIRQRIDEVDAFVLGELEPIPKNLPKSLGTRYMMEKNRKQMLEADLAVLERAFKRSEKTKKTLYMAEYSNVERPRDKFLLATESYSLAKRYAKGNKVIEIQPGAVTLDFDAQVGSPDGQEHHLFNRMQRFKLVDEDKTTITVRPL